MIRDAKGGPWAWVVAQYVARKVRQQFRGVWVRSSRGADWHTPGTRELLYANHSNFWDGFVIHQLALCAKLDGYALMQAQNLEKYPFHAKLGAIGVDRTDAREVLKSIRHCVDVLARPEAGLFIFPQGEIRAGQGPLGPLERGLEVLGRRTDALKRPIAIRYAFLEHEYPDDVGEAHQACSLDEYSSRLDEVYQRVLQARSTDGFTQIIRGRTGIQQQWDAARRLPAEGHHSREVSVGHE